MAARRTATSSTSRSDSNPVMTVERLRRTASQRDTSSELCQIGGHGPGMGRLAPAARCSQRWEGKSKIVRPRASDLLYAKASANDLQIRRYRVSLDVSPVTHHDNPRVTTTKRPTN